MKFFHKQIAVTFTSYDQGGDSALDKVTSSVGVEEVMGVAYVGWMGIAEITLHVMNNGTMSLRHGKKGYVAINRQATNDIRRILGATSDPLEPTEFFSNQARPDQYVGWVGEVPVTFTLSGGTASLRIGHLEQRDHFVMPICADMLDDIKEALTKDKVELAS